jgi:hypothetical protein
MTQTATYWRTRYGSLCERQAGPDAKGWITVMRLEDGAIREWNVSEMSPVSDAEAIAEAKSILTA